MPDEQPNYCNFHPDPNSAGSANPDQYYDLLLGTPSPPASNHPHIMMSNSPQPPHLSPQIEQYSHPQTESSTALSVPSSALNLPPLPPPTSLSRKRSRHSSGPGPGESLHQYALNRNAHARHAATLARSDANAQAQIISRESLSDRYGGPSAAPSRVQWGGDNPSLASGSGSESQPAVPYPYGSASNDAQYDTSTFHPQLQGYTPLHSVAPVSSDSNTGSNGWCTLGIHCSNFSTPTNTTTRTGQIEAAYSTAQCSGQEWDESSRTYSRCTKIVDKNDRVNVYECRWSLLCDAFWCSKHGAEESRQGTRHVRVPKPRWN